MTRRRTALAWMALAAAAPMARRRAGSSRSARVAAASAGTGRGSASSPVTPSKTTSGTPPSRPACTAVCFCGAEAAVKTVCAPVDSTSDSPTGVPLAAAAA